MTLLHPAALCLVLLSAAPAFAQDRALLVLDGSASMWGQIDGIPKLQIARSALRRVLAEPPGVPLGLMAYGHRRQGSCTDIELLVPPGTGAAPDVVQAAAQMRFQGKTPLAGALQQAATALDYRNRKATVILMTDGVESCGQDPCAMAAALQAEGADFTAHVVGIGLGPEEEAALACVAQATGGQSVTLADLPALLASLSVPATDAPAPPPAAEPEPLAQNVAPVLRLIPGGDEVDGQERARFDFYPLDAEGKPGALALTTHGMAPALLPPGRWRMTARLDAAGASTDFTANAHRMTRPEVDLRAGIVQVVLYAQEGVPLASGATWELQQQGRTVTLDRGSAARVVPAGTYDLLAHFGAARVMMPVTVAPGEIHPRPVIFGTGHVSVTVAMAPAEAAGRIQILASSRDIAGNHPVLEEVAGATGAFDLPPGSYVIRVTRTANGRDITTDHPLTVTEGSNPPVTIPPDAG